jgi:hypothetical protein
MDKVLLLSIVLIFAAAFIGSMIRYRTRDKCLKGFRGYFVTLEMLDGKRVWGALDVYHNALELVYPSPHLDPGGTHVETSFILYQDQYDGLLALRRMHDELSAENRKRRADELERTYQPGFVRRMARRIGNLCNLLRDAFSQAVSVFIGQVKKTNPSALVASQDARITSTATQIIKAGAAAYEPILEKYIGRKVVLEVGREGGTHEYCGVLKDYSDSFITLLNVPEVEECDFNLADPDQLEVNENLDFEISAERDEQASRLNLVVRLTNKGAEPVKICRAEGPDYAQHLDRTVAQGETAEFELSHVPVVRSEDDVADAVSASGDTDHAGLPPLRLWVKAPRYMDLVVPRAGGTIRHGAERVGAVDMKSLLKLVTP